MENYRSSDVLNPEVTRVGWKGKVDELRSRGTDLIHQVSERSSRVKPMIHDAMGKADREFHTNPTKWAGIAAGASFVLGMIGRELRHWTA